MTDLVVNAILHFVSCPDAEQEFNKAAIREVVVEVINEMQANSTFALNSSKPDSSQLSDEDASDLGDFMSAFRK